MIAYLVVTVFGGSARALGTLLPAVLICTAHATPPQPTPEIGQIDALGIQGMVAYAMRGALGTSGEYVGLAILCAARDDTEMQVTAFFGAFPGSHRPVQLAVRGPDGTTVERFGPVVAAGPESGVHSSQPRDPHEAIRFVSVALQSGALISNGYRSFWNRASAARNGQVRGEFLACVGQR